VPRPPTSGVPALTLAFDAWSLALWPLWIVGCFVLLVTVLPFVRSGAWWVRICDFPRLQMAFSAVTVVAGLLLLRFVTDWGAASWVLVGLLAVAAAWQLAHVVRYTPVWKHAVKSEDRSDLRLVVANVDFENERREEVLERLSSLGADVLVLVEPDEPWLEALRPLRERFSNHVEEIREMGLGLAIWSDIEIQEHTIRYIVSEKRPSIHATLRTDAGRIVHLVAVHPTPPGLPRKRGNERYGSRIRDAELLVLAEKIAQRDTDHWIVAGDFNDVAWSHTTRLFERVSGLADPRHGRGLFPTYHARHPLFRYPLDHVFVSDAFGIERMRRVRVPGSDHFGIVLDLAALVEANEEPTPADAEDEREAEELIESGVEDADEACELNR